ncbi:MAG: heme o synthase [Methylococcales bacterium]|nr:heme o synthase [Methylococcales bacterium]
MTTTTFPAKPTWRDYLGLCKLRVVALIVFTAVVGMLLATPGLPPLWVLTVGTLGIGLSASSAAAINHFLDQQADAKMARTQHRPLPEGRMQPRQVITFALALAALSMLLLGVWINWLTAVLTLLSLIGYAIIYTAYLKTLTPQNIVIGGAAGAAPPVLGWCAVTGEVHAFALLLFLIIFVWTPPHFWALAVARREEYAKANIPMLPVTHGPEFTYLHILLYTILLALVTLLPYLTGMSGLIYLAAIVPLNIVFLYYAEKLRRTQSDRLAMKTFGYSIVYLMIVFAALLVDHYLPYRL